MYTLKLSNLRLTDGSQVGMKAATLGQLHHHSSQLGITVPDGYVLTINAFEDFLSHNLINDDIKVFCNKNKISDLNVLKEKSDHIKSSILNGEFPQVVLDEIISLFKTGSLDEQSNYAIRSSGSFEDLENSSFAGQQDTFLNIKGIDNLLLSIKKVYASVYSMRAVSYRTEQGFDHLKAKMAIVMQKMVRSDLAASGVIFTIDPNTNYKGVIHITSSYGLGESIVGGEVDADEFYIDKNYLNTNLDPIIKTNCGLKQIKYVLDEYGVKAVSSNEAKLSINSEEVIKLAKIALKMEEYFAHPVDIEWAKDGITNEIMIVQSRPIVKKIEKLANSYKLLEKADVLLTGISIGNKIGCGKIKIMHDYNDLSGFNENDILVTDSTDPNWEPLMRKASALITNKGSRTCHAAIIAREIGIPAILGTKTATSLLNTNQEVTLECSLGAKGYVYDGVLNYKKDELVVPKTPTANVNWLLNIGDRASSFYWSELPVSGIGLLRMEFVINKIGIHPMSLFNYSKLNKATKNKISEIITDEDSIKEAYIKLVSKELLSIISPFKHKKITIRLSDLKSNEYRSLLGGDIFEPNEENPMLGFRGAARYLDKEFHESFLVELEILKRLQEYNINFDILVPFVRNIDEGKKVVSLLSNHGFNKHNVYMMCELPINVLLIEDFLKVFDGVSIGTNDLMQLTYGVDRDSSISDNYNANDKVLRMMIKNIITACENNDKYVSICGQEPSDNPDFTIWLIKNGMKNISLNPDSLYSIFSKVNEKQT